MRTYLQTAALAWLALTGAARAADIHVNTQDDELNTDGDCSLREAVQAANTNTSVDACGVGSGMDTIFIPAGVYNLTRGSSTDDDTNSGGDLDLTDSVVINGAGPELVRIILTHAEGNVIEIVGAISAEIRGVTLTGMGSRNNGASSGVSLTNADASLLLEDCAIVHLPGRVYGGGVFQVGDLTVRRCLFDSVGMYAIWLLQGDLVVQNTTFHAPAEGGIWVQEFGTVSVDHCTFSGPQAGLRDFGLGFPGEPSATVQVANSIFAGPGPSAEGSLTSGGGNVVSDNAPVWGPADRVLSNALLGPLEVSGGPTATRIPGAGSPAIGFGSCGVALDQRRFARPSTGCTAGAVEANPLVCGNGVVEGTEQCDGTPCCTTACTFAAVGEACGESAESACSEPDTCDGAGNCQPNHAEDGTACGDAPDACTMQDTCQGGECVDGGFAPEGTACDDGMFCNGTETCMSGQCTGSSGDPCSGGATCNEESASCTPAPGEDAGAGEPDAGAPSEDAGVADGGVAADAGGDDDDYDDGGLAADAGGDDADDDDDGCNCAVGGASSLRANAHGWLLMALLAWWQRRRLRPRC